QEDCEVYGTSLSETFPQSIISLKEKLHLVGVDLQDFERVKRIIGEIKPDEIYHLAALASPTKSFANPVETITNNVAIEINLFEAVKFHSLFQTKILITSSAEVYGIVDKNDLPMDEDTPLRPTSPYAVSKIAQDFLGFQYHQAAKLHIIRVRPFNHIGPRQTPQFVVARFASQIVDIEKGKIEPIIRVGNLDTKRDFTDVKDMVRAYRMILEKGTPGEVYNIGSGVSYKISDILEKLLSLSTVKVTVEKDPNLYRPADNPELVCDSSKMKQMTGWEPKVSLDETLKNTLDYWRSIE
ncbi:MAG: GDP-mannose 4,6-dehydratase, partial [Patescibacteria group bacterium]|nr:GDP-mannose 4,6-dehydratase [Patescibacteria group bacterium]